MHSFHRNRSRYDIYNRRRLDYVLGNITLDSLRGNLYSNLSIVCVCVCDENLSKFISLCVNFIQIMEAYSNARQFNCIAPIVEQSEYHMFCREKCELYLPDMYNKIGVGLCAWGPLSMALGDAQNGERLLFPKNSFKTKSHSYSWTEDEINKNVSESDYTHNSNLMTQPDGSVDVFII